MRARAIAECAAANSGSRLERPLVVRNGQLARHRGCRDSSGSALEVGLIRLGPARRRATQHVDLVGHQLHRERPGDVRGDVGLQIQGFAERSIVGLGPEVHFGARLDELRGDADAIALAAHAALEQVVGRQLASDLARAFRRSLEQHGRRARDDAEPARAQPADLRDHLLGQPVAEIFLRRIVAQIRERQHHEPHVDAVGHGLRGRRRTTCRLRTGCPSLSTAAMNRYPRRCSVSTNRGLSASSPSARAQPLDGGVQAVLEVDEGAGRPQALAQFFARHHLARTLEHHRENLERLILKPDADASLPQLARAQIDLEGPKSLDVRRTAFQRQHRKEKFTSPAARSGHFTKM